MLDSYDPNWDQKWDKHHARLKAVERELIDDPHNAELRREYKDLAAVQCLAFDAKHRTANEYIDLHLSLTLRDADLHNIPAWYPRLPDDAEILEARAEVRKVCEWVEEVQQHRNSIRHFITADMEPQIYFSKPQPPKGKRLAMLKWRLGKSKRVKRYHRFEGEVPKGLDTSPIRWLIEWLPFEFPKWVSWRGLGQYL